ncbi:MAG: thioredoxin, partial [Nitrosopumilus sp.]
HEKLIIRPKSNYDLSLPSGNSVSAFVMLRLYHMSQEQSFLEIATKILESQAQMAAENPFGFGYLLNAISIYLEKPVEITIINTENSELCKSLLTNYLPNSFMVTIQNSTQLENLSEYPFFTGKFFEDKTSVFVCKDFSCSLPLHTIDEINSHL